MKTLKSARMAILAPVAAATIMAAQPAFASISHENVAFADLSLSTPEGQAQLQERVDAAAWRVCRYNSRGQVADARTEHACFRAARQSARTQFADAVKADRRGG